MTKTREIHPSMQRLYAALRAAGKIAGDHPQSEAARVLCVQSQYIRNWEVRGVSKDAALQAQEMFRINATWVRTGHGDMFVPPEVGPIGPRGIVAERRLDQPDAISLPVFDARGSMGSGALRPDHDTVIDHISVTREWVLANLRGITSPRNLSVLSAIGESMAPTFSDGDILVVDRGVTDLRSDAVYVLARDGELYIKRIQRRITDGAILIKSDNPLHETVIVENGDREHLEVLGRVVWAWNGRKL